MKNFIAVGKTEEEQVEQIKQWIKNNGLQILVGVAMGLSSIWGWSYYKSYQHTQAIEARSSYLSVLANPENTDALNNLQNNYADSGYAQQALLVAAKYAMDAGGQQQALDYLLPLLSAENQFIAHTAKLRAANIYLEMGNYESALDVIGRIESTEFSSLYNHIKGDIYLAQNNIDLAKEYYQLAFEQLKPASRLKKLIKIKLDNLN